MQAQWHGHIRTQKEGSCLHTRKRGLTKKLPLLAPRSWTGLPVSSSVGKQVSLTPVVFCYCNPTDKYICISLQFSVLRQAFHHLTEGLPICKASCNPAVPSKLTWHPCCFMIHVELAIILSLPGLFFCI